MVELLRSAANLVREVPLRLGCRWVKTQRWLNSRLQTLTSSACGTSSRPTVRLVRDKRQPPWRQSKMPITEDAPHQNPRNTMCRRELVEPLLLPSLARFVCSKAGSNSIEALGSIYNGIRDDLVRGAGLWRQVSQRRPGT